MAAVRQRRWRCVRLACGLVAGLLLLPGAARAVAPLRLVVHLADYAGLRGFELRATQSAVDHAFERIGVAIDWRFDNGVPRGPGARHVTVVLLNEQMQATKLAKTSLGEGVLGTAAARAHRIYVFYPRVERTAREAAVRVSEPLAQVLTHELGHLLLADGHGELGIMREQLPPQGISGFYQFTAEQGSRIREALRPADPVATPSLSVSRQAP